MEQAAESIPAEASGPPGRPCILVVDDYPSVLITSEYMFTELGFSVVTASCGLIALELLAKRSIDLVLLDHDMPRMTGAEVCRMIRADPKLLHLPVIMMSGRMDRMLETTLLAVGANEVAKKPFDFHALAARVRNLVTPITWAPPPAT